MKSSGASRHVTGQIGATLRKRRHLLNISQKDLAELTGLAVHTISDIESGKGNPTLQVLSSLLGCLGLEIRVTPRKTAE